MTTTSSSLPLNVNWFEIAVSDLEKAARLYEATFDTKLERTLFANVPHAIFKSGERSLGALILADANRPAKGGHSTVLYLQVPNVKAALGRATEAGAKVVQGETSIGPQGTYALVADHDGNVIGIHTPAK
ncbi:MAG: VOC family protein [Kofleriaceae bacterium]